MKNKIIVIKNKIEEIEFLNQILIELTVEWDISEEVTFNLSLALEEIVTNIIYYGYDRDKEYDITIRFTHESQALRIQIKDQAPEFNPLAVEQPDDLDKPLEERKIGGLGIHLVKKFVDNISYRRNNNKNIVTLVQKLDDGN